MDRIRMLKQYAEEDPGDPFNHYALALEYLKVDAGEARRLFEYLITNHPDYLPAYYPFAQLLSENKENQKAEVTIQMGIEIARAAGDLKTLHELQSAHQDLMYGG
jgi:hypothetical protein